ncbi:hypothetical protein AcV5_006389 [Taiwanofungus camphoratus]|nr:hypothetical protein AcV5_006389 [Antrodia cinnamomea]
MSTPENNWNMSPADNSPPSDAKRQGNLPLRSQTSRYAGPSTPPCSLTSTGPFSVPSSRLSQRTMNAFAFVPRPFPPPALVDVPIEYIIDQLWHLAPHYWSKPETSDCTIVVPLDVINTKEPVLAPGPSLASPPESHSQWSASLDSSGLGQHAAGPVLRPTPRMVMQLHMDYLCAHSALLRGLLNGASPFDLIDSPPTSRPSSNRSSPTQSTHSHSHSLPSSDPTPLLPCFLPSPPTRPMIYLPVPDPVSLRLLVHYIYFGSTSFIEDALDAGTLSWEGLARNVEYLGMGPEIKVFLGRWYGRWRQRRDTGEHGLDSDSEWDSEYESDEEGGQDLIMAEQDESAATSPTLLDPEEEHYKADDEEFTKAPDPPRGRKRNTRRLGHSTSDPGICCTRTLAEAAARALRGRSQ